MIPASRKGRPCTAKISLRIKVSFQSLSCSKSTSRKSTRRIRYDPKVTFQPDLLWQNQHLQTTYRGIFRRSPTVGWLGKKVLSEYGDYLDLDCCLAQGKPSLRLLVLHGITGCSGASPIPDLALGLSTLGVETWALNLRGSQGQKPQIPRLYHAGCSEEVEAIFNQLPQDLPWRFLGISLGANLLLKWLGEDGGRQLSGAKAMVVSCPFDLAECSANLERTAMTRLYRLVLIRRLKVIVKSLLAAHPNALDWQKVAGCRTFFDFDEHVTAPLHGFDGAWDYWNRNSSFQFLTSIKIPTLLLHAWDDPFQPKPPDHIRTQNLHWEIYQNGGHVGFQESFSRDWLVSRIVRFVNL